MVEADVAHVKFLITPSHQSTTAILLAGISIPKVTILVPSPYPVVQTLQVVLNQTGSQVFQLII
ncbi:MAG: hypothetical protein LBF15_03935 [Candidatus Peribacteria bacterium]|jgi:hypothetical protein|nr:hypothetical protein [Candidatus Peribacteria bacterium]